MDLTPEISDEMIDAFQDAWAAHNNVHRVGDEHGELLSDGTCCDRAGLLAVVPKIREAAYQAGREDAARAVESVFPTSTDAMRAFLARHRLSDTPSVGAVSVALLADVRAISLGRSAGGVGDNPEERAECESCGRTARYCKCEQDGP